MFCQSLHFVLVISLISFNLSAFQLCPIYLTISLNGKSIKESFLEINWGPNCIEKPDWIGIFREDPSISYIKPDFRLQKINNTSGKFITNVRIGNINFPGGWNKNDSDNRLINYAKGKCLPFYIAGFIGNDLMTIECLKIQPNWMGMTVNIGKIPLKHVFIPGTHSSGAYDSTLKRQSPMIKNYGCSQNLDVWSQLVFGIRFLDFRIGYRNSSNDFWIVNENMLITELKPILNDIKRFAIISGEIVILDFSYFPIGFHSRPDLHTLLLQILREELGDIVFNRSETSLKNAFDLSMNNIRSAGKHIIILYSKDVLSCADKECEFIWPSWKRFSIKNYNNSETLDFMKLLFSQKDLTHTTNKGWIFEATRGLEHSFNSQNLLQTTRNRAYDINSKITNYLGGPWSLAANIVTLDFFSTTNIVDIAIYSNTNKAFTLVNRHLTNFDIGLY